MSSEPTPVLSGPCLPGIVQVEVWWRLSGAEPYKRWASDPDPTFPFPVLWVRTHVVVACHSFVCVERKGFPVL